MHILQQGEDREGPDDAANAADNVFSRGNRVSGCLTCQYPNWCDQRLTCTNRVVCAMEEVLEVDVARGTMCDGQCVGCHIVGNITWSVRVHTIMVYKVPWPLRRAPH